MTAIEFAVQPVDELYAGAMFFPFERSAEVLHAWSALLPTLPDELMSWASLMHFPPIPDVPAFARGRSFAVVMAAFLGSEAEGRALLRAAAPARTRARHVRHGPARRARRPRHGPARPGAVPPRACAARRAAGGDDRRTDREGRPRLGSGPDRRRCSSSATWAERWRARHRAPAPARRCPARSAWLALGAVFDEQSDAAVRAALADFEAAMLPHRVGDYPNFVEVPVDASGFFEPHVWARLREVKARTTPPTCSQATTTSPAVAAEQT